jgi:hypothetical protein
MGLLFYCYLFCGAPPALALLHRAGTNATMWREDVAHEHSRAMATSVPMRLKKRLEIGGRDPAAANSSAF